MAFGLLQQALRCRAEQKARHVGMHGFALVLSPTDILYKVQNIRDEVSRTKRGSRLRWPWVCNHQLQRRGRYSHPLTTLLPTLAESLTFILSPVQGPSCRHANLVRVPATQRAIRNLCPRGHALGCHLYLTLASGRGWVVESFPARERLLELHVPSLFILRGSGIRIAF